MFGIKKSKTKTVKFTPVGTEVEYGSVVGFFEFRGEIYYRAKGVSARNIFDDTKSFTATIKEKYPDEFSEIRATEVSALKVSPLIVVK